MMLKIDAADLSVVSPTVGKRFEVARLSLSLCVAGALLLQGCATSNMTDEQRATLKGAVLGAVAGAVIGEATGGKAGQGAVIGGVVGAVAGNVWSRHMEEKRKALEKATQGTGVDVARTADNRIKLNIPSDFSFDTNSAAVKPTMKPVLDEVARGLDNTVYLDVVGHTDSTGTDAINKPLSINRADSVRGYLAARGVASSRIAINGLGASQPVASNDTLDGRAQNRRVEIYLADKGTAVAPR